MDKPSSPASAGPWATTTSGFAHGGDRMLLCGLDEAGRGALAGPLVLAAVVMDTRARLEDYRPDIVVRDSKKLTPRQRQSLYEAIQECADKVDVEIIGVDDINTHGINWAEVEGFARLISRITADFYVVDGRWPLRDLGEKAKRVECRVHADEEITPVLAAGVIAKVERDQVMRKLSESYPDYSWQSNTGHGTGVHLDAIRSIGICEQHRVQFVKTALRKWPHEIRGLD